MIFRYLNAKIYEREVYLLSDEITQWHPAFCSALKLELSKNREDLIYFSEYGINTKPIQIDLLIITKTSTAVIENEIGTIFKGHNIIEYKSPDDELNIDTFFKVIAYACLYKSTGHFIDDIKARDITITFVRERKPVKLFKKLTLDGFTIFANSNGIYNILTGFYFDIQVIVTKELNEDHHIWLSSLTQTISKSKAEKLLCTVADLYRKDDKEFAESVLQVAMSKNKNIFGEIKEENEMCEALRELMKPEIDAEVDKRVKKIVAEKLAEKDSALAEIDSVLAEKDSALAEKDSALAEKDEEIKTLKAKLAAAGIY